MRKKLLTVICFIVVFWAGTRVSSAEIAPSPVVTITITTQGPIGVPFEWWGDAGGGLVVMGTGPDFRVFLNGEEKFPLPCPVGGGCFEEMPRNK